MHLAQCRLGGYFCLAVERISFLYAASVRQCKNRHLVEKGCFLEGLTAKGLFSSPTGHGLGWLSGLHSKMVLKMLDGSDMTSNSCTSWCIFPLFAHFHLVHRGERKAVERIQGEMQQGAKLCQNVVASKHWKGRGSVFEWRFGNFISHRSSAMAHTRVAGLESQKDF